jgi:hypothetical protein
LEKIWINILDNFDKGKKTDKELINEALEKLPEKPTKI